MIHLEVKETKDFDVLGKWEFHKNELLLGGIASLRGDIKINNEGFRGEAVKVVVSKKKLLVELLDQDVCLLVAGKRTIGTTLLEKGSLFQVGHTLFEVKDFSYSKHNFGPLFYENLKKNHSRKSSCRKNYSKA